MTTELEQEFFKVFGIEPSRHVCYIGFDRCIDNDFNCHCHNEKPCKHSTPVYPEITDRVLLKLICCVPKTVLNNCTTIKEIKEAVLKDLILCMRKYTAQELKQQIQQLFKEGE